MIDIEIINLGEFERDMQGIVDKLKRKELLKTIRPSARTMLREVVSQTPVRTGFLAKNMTIKPMRGRADDPFASYMVGPKAEAFYGIMVHNGTIVVPGEKRKHRRRESIPAGAIVKIKANPWISRAFEAKAAECAEQLMSAIEKKL